MTNKYLTLFCFFWLNIFAIETFCIELPSRFKNANQVPQLLRDPQFESHLKRLAEKIPVKYINNANAHERFVLAMIKQDLQKAKVHLKKIIKSRSDIANWQAALYRTYWIYLNAKELQYKQVLSFEVAYRQALFEYLSKQSLTDAEKIFGGYNFSLDMGEDWVAQWFRPLQAKKELSEDDLLTLIDRYQPLIIFREVLPIISPLIQAFRQQHYDINTDVLIKTPKGITLSAIVVKNKRQKRPVAAVLRHGIYADLDNNLASAINAASRGYVGVVSDTRGKRLSPSKIVPYEHEAEDVTAIINWLSKQTFCDGRVVMYGGSYLGFTQWAATKYMPTALKTIVPSVANNPMQGLPMENNIFITANYQWPFYVTNNKTLDTAANSDRARWQQLLDTWYASGRAYREIDQLDITLNPWLQKWLKYPSHDQYWLSFGPVKEEYKRINIPILSINGYYDDGHISALYYLNEHLKYNASAEHYWVIGPYNHFFRNSPWINGYKKDPIASLDRDELAFQWFAHVLEGAPRPSIIKDKVNYQLMADNTWQHASSMVNLNAQSQRFYLSDKKQGNYGLLSESKPVKNRTHILKLDLSNTQISTNTDYYPYPIIKDKLKDSSGLTFVSPAFDEEMAVYGSFSGELKVNINKKDFDFGLSFYELMPDGKLFQLSYYIGRASYANDPSKRQLLTPNTTVTLPFANTRMTGKKFAKGSRLLVVVNINKNNGAQINYGSGKDVSDESVKDAGGPLVVKWQTNSFINVPMKAMSEF